MKRIKFYIIAFVLVLTTIVIIDLCWPPDPGNIIAESHGMVFDIVFFGIVLSIYEFFLQKREKLSNHLQELADFRGWNEPEAMYRNVGLLRRIIRDKKRSYFKIQRTFLNNSELTEMHFTETTFDMVNMKGSKIEYTSFSENSKLARINAVGVKLLNSQFSDFAIDKSCFCHSYFETHEFIVDPMNFQLIQIPKENQNHFQNGSITNVKFNFMWLTGNVAFKNVHFENVSFCPLITNIPTSIDGDESLSSVEEESVPQLVFEDCTFSDVFAWSEQKENFLIKNAKRGDITYLNTEGTKEKILEDYQWMKKIFYLYPDADLSLVDFFDFENDERLIRFYRIFMDYFKEIVFYKR